jgi:hypothetical protein
LITQILQSQSISELHTNTALNAVGQRMVAATKLSGVHRQALLSAARRSGRIVSRGLGRTGVGMTTEQVECKLGEGRGSGRLGEAQGCPWIRAKRRRPANIRLSICLTLDRHLSAPSLFAGLLPVFLISSVILHSTPCHPVSQTHTLRHAARVGCAWRVCLRDRILTLRLAARVGSP